VGTGGDLDGEEGRSRGRLKGVLRKGAKERRAKTGVMVRKAKKAMREWEGMHRIRPYCIRESFSAGDKLYLGRKCGGLAEAR